MRVKLVTDPAVEPVTLAEAKYQIRVDVTDEDYYISGLITAVRKDVEAYLNRALITQTFDFYMNAWPSKSYIKIPMPPLQSVTSITYTDKDGISAVFASSNYIVDTASEPGQIFLKYDKSWPAVDLQVINGLVIRFVAGYGLAANVPENIKQAMLLYIGTFFENREDAIVGNVTQQPLIGGAEALLAKFRIPPSYRYG